MATSFQTRYFRFLVRRSERHESFALPIALFWPVKQERQVTLEKLGAALELLASTGAKFHKRLVQHVGGIWVFGHAMAPAEWHRALRLVRVSYDYVTSPTTTVNDLACTLAHEATHAWLGSLGIGYPEHLRARIEAICARVEIALARRLPNGDAQIRSAEASLRRDPSFWSDMSLDARNLRRLEALGTPQLIVSLLRWRVHRRHAA